MLIDSEIIDDALLDIALVKENGEYENQLEVANRVRTEIAMDVVNVFAEVVPYEITTNIFNQTTYIWNNVFVNKVLDVLKIGVYGNELTRNEKSLIKSYVDFKYNNGDSSELLISLDNYIGAM